MRVTNVALMKGAIVRKMLVYALCVNKKLYTLSTSKAIFNQSLLLHTKYENTGGVSGYVNTSSFILCIFEHFSLRTKEKKYRRSEVKKKETDQTFSRLFFSAFAIVEEEQQS